MKLHFKSCVLLGSLVLILFLLIVTGSTFAVKTATAASSSITISPAEGIVGSGIIVSGQSYPPNAELSSELAKR